MSNTVEELGKLVSKNITVVMYTDDDEYICNWLGREVISLNVGALGLDKKFYSSNFDI